MQQASTNFNLVIFGGTGDLSTRKLLPALYMAYTDNNLNKSSKIFCTGRKSLSTTEFHTFAHTKALEAGVKLNEKHWQDFCSILEYVEIDAQKVTTYSKLQNSLDKHANTIFYLSTSPNLFLSICENLAKLKLNTKNSKIVLEKPLGEDLASSNEINDFVAKYFTEKQIYRIDHYLGKESVQNIMAIRFGNTLFEALWRRQWISSIQITIAEQIGVGSRGEFYDKTGALRDMLQNHLLQLLCVVAMEPPFSLDADILRNEKLKVLQSLKPWDDYALQHNIVRGQYSSGEIDGLKISGYVDEDSIPANSITDTFIAVKAEIQNWRWAGVPFYLRTGKRLKSKLAEIVVQFKDIPCKIFPFSQDNQANRLIIQLQPDETIKLYFLAKQPGDTNELKPVYLDLDFHKTFNIRRAEGYERLLLDIIRGNLSLFVRRDEQMAAWKWVEPILDMINNTKVQPELYRAGSFGPKASDELITKDGFKWHEQLNPQ